jgi:hypothetical protein
MRPSLTPTQMTHLRHGLHGIAAVQLDPSTPFRGRQIPALTDRAQVGSLKRDRRTSPSTFSLKRNRDVITNRASVRRALKALFGGAHGEPGLAQGEAQLGRLECSFAGRRAGRAVYSRWHGGRVRLDHKATAISLLVVLGVRMVSKVLLAVKAMGGESSDA